MNEVIYNFTGKKFVVTGASSGMGRQIALELAEAGAIVLAIARGQRELENLKKQYSDRIMLGAVDVTDSDAIEESIKSFVETYGKLNGCIHAAGIVEFTPLKTYDELVAKKIMDVSFWAGIKIVQISMKNKYASIGSSAVLFSSVSGNKGEKGMFAYSGAKAALKVSIKSLANELATKKHRINTISPGFVETNMTNQTIVSDESLKEHLLGIGAVTDVSGVVLFLLSDRASWITGTDIIVDGGYLV